MRKSDVIGYLKLFAGIMLIFPLVHVFFFCAMLSIGSLGGGNHFIEVGKSEKTSDYYLIIHTGIRKLGGDVCKY